MDAQQPGSSAPAKDSMMARASDPHPARPAAGGAQASPDWQIWFGMLLTFTYLILISIYVQRVVGWSRFLDEPIDQVGDFLQGAFAPLAFLWLVIGYFLQKQELSSNTAALMHQNEVIRLSAEQAVIQSRGIIASEQHARKDSFLRIADGVKQQLGVILGFLFLSSQGAAGAARAVSEERISELWGAMSSGDSEIFTRHMLTLQLTHGERYSYKLCFGTAIRTRHTLNFLFNFERLLRAAEQCDSDGMIGDALLGSAHGYFYSRVIALRAHPPQGFRFDVYDFDPDTID